MSVLLCGGHNCVLQLTQDCWAGPGSCRWLLGYRLLQHTQQGGHLSASALTSSGSSLGDQGRSYRCMASTVGHPRSTSSLSLFHHQPLPSHVLLTPLFQMPWHSPHLCPRMDWPGEGLAEHCPFSHSEGKLGPFVPMLPGNPETKTQQPSPTGGARLYGLPGPRW